AGGGAGGAAGGGAGGGAGGVGGLSGGSGDVGGSSGGSGGVGGSSGGSGGVGGSSGGSGGVGGSGLGGPRVGGEIHVNTHLPQDQEHPRVAMASDGRFVVVWMSRGQAASGTSELYGQRFNADGTKAGAELQISATNASSLYWGPNYYDVAMAPDGRFVVAWSGYGGTDRKLYAQAFDATGAKTGAQQIVDSTTDQWTEYQVSLAMTKTGDFAVLFDWEKGFTAGAKLRLYTAAAAPKAAAFWVANKRRVHDIDLASNDNGDMVAAWHYYDTDTEVFAQRIDPAGSLLAGELSVNTSTKGAQNEPSVAVRADGSFGVVWQSTHAAPSLSQGVFAQLFDKSGNKQGGELAVSLSTSGIMEQPGIGVDSTGRWVVTWFNDGGPVAGKGDEVWAQRFNADGSRPEPTFRVNTFDEGDQDDSRIAMAPGGRFVIAWSDHAQEEKVAGNTTHDSGVFAQLFQP
ncbi:MAG: hypothetical protein HYZ29_05145, partial [Myxococcales bacterium]|nr:hypothetical protein [Myxococcales bacterium]